MTTHASTPDIRQSLDRLKLLMWSAAAATAVAISAGALLLILEPTSGSAAEGALGLAAAIGGLATGALVIAAAIYAQIKDLWRLAPIGIRIGLWAFIGLGIVVTLFSQISQLVGS
jgi:hypothetical protein